MDSWTKIQKNPVTDVESLTRKMYTKRIYTNLCAL